MNHPWPLTWCSFSFKHETASTCEGTRGEKEKTQSRKRRNRNITFCLEGNKNIIFTFVQLIIWGWRKQTVTEPDLDVSLLKALTVFNDDHFFCFCLRLRSWLCKWSLFHEGLNQSRGGSIISTFCILNRVSSFLLVYHRQKLLKIHVQ